MFTLEIDDREPDDMFVCFDKEGGERKFNVSKKRLNCSDYAIYYGGTLLFIIERKTWDDLAQSIKDGRIDEQIKKMQSLPQEIKKFILIEGTLKAQHQHIEAKNLLTKIDHIILRGDTNGVLYSSSILGTCKRIIQLIDHHPLDLSKITVKTERDNVLNTMKGTSNEKLVTDMFAAIKGVAYNTARLFMDNKWSIMDLYESESHIVAEMVYPLSGSIVGITKAKSICDDMDTIKCWTGILTSINGITSTTAKVILEKYPVIYDWNVENLSQVCKGEKSRIGKKIATRIIELLNFKIIS